MAKIYLYAMLMEKFEVGKIFPLHQNVNSEGGRAILTEGLFYVVLGLNNIQSLEIDAFNTYEFTFGVIDYEDLCIFMVRYGDQWTQEITINVHGIDNNIDKQQWIENDTTLLPMFLVENNDLILKAMRLVNIDQMTANQIKFICNNQRKRYPTFYAIDKAYKDFMERFTKYEVIDMVEWVKL